MFATGIKEIYSKIEGIQNKLEKKKAFVYLETQLLKNKYLKHQFKILNYMKENVGKCTPAQTEKVLKTIRESNIKFVSENKANHLHFWNANKELFEYFNINAKKLQVSALDNSIDVYVTSKALNEGTIKQLLTKKAIKTKKSDSFLTEKKNFKEKVNLLKESFISLNQRKDMGGLKKKFQIINFLSESMPTKTKNLTRASLKTLVQEAKTKGVNKTLVEKTMKLAVIAEKHLQRNLTEAGPGVRYDYDKADFSKEPESKKQLSAYKKMQDEINNFYKAKKADSKKAPVSTTTARVKGKPATAAPADKPTTGNGPGKRVSMPDLKYLKKIEISAPSSYRRPGQMMFSFKVPLYPNGYPKDNAIKTTAIQLMLKFLRMEKPFINACIYQKDRTNIFDPSGIIWEGGVSTLQYGKSKIEALQNGTGKPLYGSINVYIKTNQENLDSNSWEDILKSSQDIMRDMDKVLPELMGDLSANLDTDNIDYPGDTDKSLIYKYIHRKSPDAKGAIVDDGGVF